MIDKNLLNVLLAHARYSFAEVDWNFNHLTMREKSLIKNQQTLDEIKKISSHFKG